MSITVLLKNHLPNIPPSIGRLLNYLPYSMRPGLSQVYTRRSLEIQENSAFSLDERRNFVFTRIKKLVDYSYEHVPFYFEFYNQKNFHPSELRCFKDIQKIPIVDKTILSGYPIEKRSSKIANKYLVNTGGSTGSPFSFFIQDSSIGHEWAHMHVIWQKLGYKSSDLKLLFGGRSNIKNIVDYDFLRNHFALDIYADYNLVAEKLTKLLQRHQVRYLHGYPSSIYDFALFCRDENPLLLKLLAKNLKGVFLGSEYPHSVYRDAIETIFKVETISWYGHTERAVLAYEKNEDYKYEPFITYGFSEALSCNDKEYSLIGTSYYNFASPLIRYNTDDIISDPVLNEGILESFKIARGRNGDVVIDKNNKKINLTGLIFGRHHDLFNHCNFLQVKQVVNGKIEIHFVSSEITQEQASKLFDSRNLELDVDFVKRDTPIRTSSGKINLLIK